MYPTAEQILAYLADLVHVEIDRDEAILTERLDADSGAGDEIAAVVVLNTHVLEVHAHRLLGDDAVKGSHARGTRNVLDQIHLDLQEVMGTTSVEQLPILLDVDRGFYPSHPRSSTSPFH